MTRTTRQRYETRRAALLAQQGAVLDESNRLEAALGAAPSCEDIDRLNGLMDAAYDIERRLIDLDQQWETRNWTQQDWSEWRLVTANID